MAIRRSYLDIPNQRSSHQVPTPRIGGLGIALIWYVCIIIPTLRDLFFANIALPLLFGFPIAIVSFLDDLRPIRASVRFFTHLTCIAATLVIIFNRFEVDENLFVLWLSVFILIIIGTWFINLYNFLDGIDGYAASQAIIFFIISYRNTGEKFLLLAIAVLIGFLIFNWHPARIFMGDTGSTLLGFIIFISAVIFHITGSQPFLISLAYTSVFWTDATITLFRRILNKEKISKPHKKHAYQRLSQSGINHSGVTLIMISIYLILGIIQHVFLSNRDPESILVFCFSLIGSFVYILLSDIRKPFPK